MAKPDPVFAALADPTRRAILESLKGGGQAAGRIARQFDVSWPAVSRHLKILRAAGLVWETRDGRSRYYEINQPALTPVLGWLSQFRVDPVRAPALLPSLTSSAGREYSS